MRPWAAQINVLSHEQRDLGRRDWKTWLVFHTTADAGSIRVAIQTLQVARGIIDVIYGAFLSCRAYCAHTSTQDAGISGG